MPTETARPKQTTTPKAETTPDFLGEMWGTTLNMQRQWMDLWTRPFGTMPTADRMWSEWHKLNTECLDFNRHANELTHDFMNDQVKIGKEFADKTVDMTRELDLHEARDTAPKLTREWFDTTRRSVKRTITFSTESLKTVEEFGLNVAESLTRATADKN